MIQKTQAQLKILSITRVTWIKIKSFQFTPRRCKLKNRIRFDLHRSFSFCCENQQYKTWFLKTWGVWYQNDLRTGNDADVSNKNFNAPVSDLDGRFPKIFFLEAAVVDVMLHVFLGDRGVPDTGVDEVLFVAQTASFTDCSKIQTSKSVKQRTHRCSEDYSQGWTPGLD